MLPRQYPRPPVTEGIIELRFGAPIEPTDVEKIGTKLANHYPNASIWTPIGGFFVGSEAPGFPLPEQTHRRASEDASEILVLGPTTFGIAQLPPYVGWDHLVERFQRDWAVRKKVAGYQPISRLGVRYINRIDVPFKDGLASFEEADYLNIRPATPELLGPNNGYGMQMMFKRPAVDGQVIINTGIILPAPMLNFVSFLLDIDLYTQHVPQKDSEIWELFSRMRQCKDEVFEACITDKARELFQ